MSEPRRFSLVGPGRAGRSFEAALTEVGWELVEVFERGDDLSAAAEDVDVCLIATPDSAIEGVASAISSTDAVVMHVSGATPLSALGVHRAAGLHPLVSLAEPNQGAIDLRTAHFAVAGDPVAREIAEQLSGRWFEISDDNRVLYHCAAVIASNHLVALLGQVERLASSIDVPFEVFAPLIQSSIDNTNEFGASAALTGPAARGDSETIEAHRRALRERHGDELASYDALVELAERLAGRLDEP